MSFGDNRKPLKRGKPLKAGKGLQRTEFKRKPPTIKAKRPKAKPDPIPASERAKVRERSGGVCEICHTQRGVTMHHRELRRHGNHTAGNLLHLCAACHTLVHGPWCASGMSYLMGYLIHAKG